MVVDSYRQHALGVVLADHVIVEHPADIARTRNPVARLDQRRLVLLTDDVHAELDALVADEHGGTRDQLPDLMLALATEGAVQRIFRVATAGLSHCHSITGSRGPVRGRADLADSVPAEPSKGGPGRSEERRVGKEWRSRGAPYS